MVMIVSRVRWLGGNCVEPQVRLQVRGDHGTDPTHTQIHVCQGPKRGDRPCGLDGTDACRPQARKRHEDLGGCVIRIESEVKVAVRFTSSTPRCNYHASRPDEREEAEHMKTLEP
jgi:hypothetical protein